MRNIIVKACLIAICLLITYKVLCITKYNYVKYNSINNYINDKVNNEIYGYIKIDKINLMEVLYKEKSKYNSLDKGLFIIGEKPLIILGHSGHGKLALFNDLDKLYIGDLIEINVNNKSNIYKIEYIMNKNKSDKISSNLDLTLVTCDKNNMNQKLEISAKKVTNY